MNDEFRRQARNGPAISWVLKTNSSPSADLLPFQLPLCPALPLILGNRDSSDFEVLLDRIDGLLRSGGVEAFFVRLSLDALRAEAREAGVEVSDRMLARHQEQRHARKRAPMNVAERTLHSCRSSNRAWRCAARCCANCSCVRPIGR